MQKRGAEFKLPQIKKGKKEPEKMMSKTVNTSLASSKTRPSSSKKVQDLEKQLFSKLDSYEGTSKRSIVKKLGRSSKKIEMDCSTGTESTPQNYGKMQKMMPGLYSKMIETKKSSFMQQEAGLFQGDPFREEEQLREVPLQEREKRKDSKSNIVSEIQTQQTDRRQDYFGMMSEFEMESVFDEYLSKEGLTLGGQTTNKEMQELGSTINGCQKQIENIKRAMTSLIQELEIDCLPLADEEADC